MKTSEVADALTNVIDPELGIDIVSLGLVYGIEVDESDLSVLMTVTSPQCPMGDAIASMAGSRLTKAAEGREVHLELTFDPPWSIHMADYEALVRFGLVPAKAGGGARPGP